MRLLLILISMSVSFAALSNSSTAKTDNSKNTVATNSDNASSVDSEVPALSCKKPKQISGLSVSKDASTLERDRATYSKCVNKYTTEMAEKMKTYLELAKKYQQAANNAINEYNTWATAFNEKLKQEGQKP